MRFSTTVPLFGLATLVASTGLAQTSPGPLPSPYIQQVAPGPPAPPPTGPPPDRIYGTREATGEEIPVEGPQVEDPNAPPIEDPNVDPNAGPPADPGAYSNVGAQGDPNAYGGEYDLTSDNAVAQSYDDGYDPQAAGQFQQELAPYGTWFDDPAYGRVWTPATGIVGADFAPYATGGHWALTEFGWTWASVWSWGWAPFHYGRWTTIGARGWCWVPGTLWGPAWVAWRAGGGFVGWSALPPRGVWIGQPAGRGSNWRFVQASDMGARRPAYLAPHAVPGVFGHTTVVSNARTMAVGGTAVAVNAGPTRYGHPTEMGRLATVAPTAVPRLAVRPHLGAPIAARPWVRAGIAATAPAHRSFAGPATPYRAAPAAPGAMPRSFGRAVAPPPRAFAPPPQAYTPPRTVSPPPRAFAPPRSYFAPSRSYTASPPRTVSPAPGATVSPRAYAPPPRAFAPPPRAPPPRFYAPAARPAAPPVQVYSPPQMYAPAPRAFAPPPPRAYTPPPAYHPPAYSAPRTFSPPATARPSGGFGQAGGRSFGGHRR